MGSMIAVKAQQIAILFTLYILVSWILCFVDVVTNTSQTLILKLTIDQNHWACSSWRLPLEWTAKPIFRPQHSWNGRFVCGHICLI